MIERPRARRYRLAAAIELTDMESELEVRGQLSNLSLFGCRVTSLATWASGTRVRLRIIHRGGVFTALGQIANIQTKGAIGVVFTRIEPKDQSTLEKWIAELRDVHERASPVP